MPVSESELTRRLERADQARLALRRATLELLDLGVQLRQSLAERHGPSPGRPDSRRAGDLPRPLGAAD